MSVKKEEIDNGLRFTYENGQTRDFLMTDLSDEMRERLIIHGMKGKLGDAYAGQPENAEEITDRVWQSLLAGDWRSGSEGGPRVTQLARALAEVAGKSLEEAVETLANLDDEKKKQLRAHPAVKAALTKIQLEDAQRKLEKATAEAEQAEPLNLNI